MAARPWATVWTSVPHSHTSFGRRRYYLFRQCCLGVYLFMTEKTFKQILLKLNKGVAIDGLLICPLIENVYYGFYWEYSTAQLSNHSTLFPKKLYIIKSDSGTWSSIVYPSGNDLHWYTLQKFRRKGILSQALLSYILPHVYQEEKTKAIDISIDPSITEYTASKHLALKLGFKLYGERNGTEIYRKTRPKNLVKIAPINNKLLLENAIKICRVIMNFVHLLHTHCGVTTLAQDADKVLMPLENNLSTLKYKMEELLWEEEQKIQQS